VTTVSFSSGYSPPEASSVDFVFADAGETWGDINLPSIGVFGVMTTAEYWRGDIVLKLPYVTGGMNGARTYVGQMSLPAIGIEGHAVINNPIELPKLVIEGSFGWTGSLTLPVPQINVGSSDIHQDYCVGDIVLPRMAINGQATTPMVARGDIRLKHIVVSGELGKRCDLSLPKIIMDGQATTVPLFTGEIDLPSLKMNGHAIIPEMMGNDENSPYSIPMLRVDGHAIVGGVFSADYDLKCLQINGAATFSAEDLDANIEIPRLKITGHAVTKKPPYIIRHRRYSWNA